MFNAIPVFCENEEPVDNKLSLVSNKLGGYITIQAENLGENVFYDLVVYDSSGKQVFVGQHFTESGQVNDNVQIINQATGVYIVKLMVGSKVLSEKTVW